VPAPLPPPLEQRVIGQLFDVLDFCRTRLTRLEGPINALPCKTALLGAIRTREVQASSKIENTFASVREIMLADLSETRARDESLEVLRNRKAVEYGLKSRLPLSGRLLRAMHRVLIVDPSKTPGAFRTGRVCIGDDRLGFDKARFVPPPASHIEGCMSDWERFVNPRAEGSTARKRLPYFAELAIAHYQFETIHPFADGNGRLGRALITLGPVKDGELEQPVRNLSERVHEHRQEYDDRLLRVSTHGDWEGWIRFFCTALAEQAAADDRRANRLGSLYKNFQALLTKSRHSVLLLSLLDFIFERQGVTISLWSVRQGVSYTAAQRHVQTLEKLGILEVLGDSRYDRVFYSPAVLRAIRGQGED